MAPQISVRTHKNRIGNVGEAEEQSSDRDGLPAARGEAKDSRQKITLQEELLHQRPDEVSPHVSEERGLAEE